MNTNGPVMKSLLLLFLCVLAAGCNNRSALTPDKALIGHWVRDSDSAHRYFSASKSVYVTGGGRQNFPYQVVTVSSSGITLKETGPLIGWTANFEFTPNRKEMTESRLREDGTKMGQWKWRYSDDKEAPY